MGYSINPAQVRVDFFTESGKWHDTIEMEWLEYDDSEGDKVESIHDIFIRSIFAYFEEEGGVRLRGTTAICLEPYHEHSYPLMVHNWDSPRKPYVSLKG
ncbi:MAG: hypothetical protein OEY89_13490 [Gammaproteobacteria bacterium]|nr:hypothetical protein [Gammaproteobacteria bacterium]